MFATAHPPLLSGSARGISLVVPCSDDILEKDLYSIYWIDGIEGMDVDTFFARTRKFLIDLLSRETINRAVRSQATTWIRFVKDEVEQVELAFNSRMLAVYNLSDMDEIVSAMIEHMKQQIENAALSDTKFVFDRIIPMDIDFHRLNLTRGSSCIPLPDWLAKKKAIINPKNSDLECFKWAVIAAMRWAEIDRDHQTISKLRKKILTGMELSFQLPSETLKDLSPETRLR